MYDWFIFHLMFMNVSEDMVDELKIHLTPELLSEYETDGYITSVKKKKKNDHYFSVLRLSKKGKEVYRNSQILDYTVEDERLLEYLKAEYENLEKPIGNELKVKQLLAWFRAETNYSRRMIFKASKAYVNNMVDNGKDKYIPSLENFLWKAPNVFSAKWTLANSKLYQFIQEHKHELNADISN